MKLSDLFRDGKFVVTCEVGPPKGTNVARCIAEAEPLRGIVDAINVTDNQTAVMRVSSLGICGLLKQNGFNPVLQMTTRDRNRIALQSDLLGAAALGVDNALLLTGDHTSMGDHKQAKPVYDLDSVSLIHVAKGMKEGFDIEGNELDGKLDMCIGGVATPGAEPAELHLIKLRKKVEHGAEFIQTQTIYEPEQFDIFMDSVKEMNVPVLVGHVMLKSAGMAKYMNRFVPGVSVPDEMIGELERAPKNKRVERSIELSLDLLNELKKKAQGIHLMPMGWTKHVPRILEEVL